MVVAAVMASCGSSAPPSLTDEHRAAVSAMLKARQLSDPNQLEVASSGFVTADYEVPDLAVGVDPGGVRSYAAARLLAIREALLPFGFRNYRVNINGPPPGAGLVRRYGSARFIEGGSLEWITP